MKRLLLLVLLLSFLASAQQRPLPVTGSWINLFYQDVRNKYTNPENMDNTSPELWKAKVNQMHRMGIEYIVFMAVANDGLADYPSKIMPHAYPLGKQSPVCAIMEQAEKCGMKVFLSIGWAENQDDNLKRPEILARQLAIMEELAEIYGNNSAFYGWYLPVEDCLGPVLPETSVKAVNSLVQRAKNLTPGKKTMISPYGFFCSEFDNPLFAQRISQLEVDIIAYQDEVGCVRENFPMPRLRENWMKIRAIHDAAGIELWANCELFTWEKGTNSRSSALIPAAMPRIASQLQAASAAGVSRIISFMTCGIFDDGSDDFTLGQPALSLRAWRDYEDWKAGKEEYVLLEQAFAGKLDNKGYAEGNPLFDNVFGGETPEDKAWTKITENYSEYCFNAAQAEKIYVRFLNCEKRGIKVPYKVSLSKMNADGSVTLLKVKDFDVNPNAKHDTWIEGMVFDIPEGVSSAVLGIYADSTAMTDEIVLL